MSRIGRKPIPVPSGVTVTIESPQMAGTRDVVTDDQGRYQFGTIPPGTYKVTFSLPGFTTLVREGIQVGMGFTAALNAHDAPLD